MNRNQEFNKTKLTSVSNGKCVVDTYVDAFGIEKVKMVVSEFEGSKNSVDAYLDFPDVLRIAEQVKNRTMLKKIKNSNGQGVDLYRGGSAGSKREDGKTIAKVLTMNMSDTGKIFINASAGPGKEAGKGAIIPDGKPEVRISCSMPYDDCLAMFMYIDLAVRAYLPGFFRDLIKAASEKRTA